MICQDCLCNFFLYFNLLIRFIEVIEFFFQKKRHRDTISVA